MANFLLKGLPSDIQNATSIVDSLNTPYAFIIKNTNVRLLPQKQIDLVAYRPPLGEHDNLFSPN